MEGRSNDPTHPPPAQHCPWLVFTHGANDAETQRFFSIDEEDCFYDKHIPNMSNKYINPCSHGWLHMMDIDTDDNFLLNPSSMTTIELPPWDLVLDLSLCDLSLPPADPRSLFLAFARHAEGRPYIRFCHPGDTQWVDHELESEDMMFNDLAVCKGKFYGLKKTLMVLDIVNSNSSFDVHTRSLVQEQPWESLVPPETYNQTRFLVESCQEIYHVYLAFLDLTEVRDVLVFRLDFEQLSWVKVESLGDCAFFLNMHTVAHNLSQRIITDSSSGSSGIIKGNSIYFTGVHEDENVNENLYVFDLEDNSFLVSRLPGQERMENVVDRVWINYTG